MFMIIYLNITEYFNIFKIIKMSNYDTKIYKIKNLKEHFKKTNNKNVQKQSCYFITINSNQRVNKNSKNDMKYVKRFEQVCISFCSNISRFVLTHDGFPTDDNRTVEIVPQIEISPDRKLLHIHMAVEILHFSRIKMDLSAIRGFFKHNLSNNCHVLCKWYPGTKITNSDRIKNYILKGTGGYSSKNEMVEINDNNNNLDESKCENLEITPQTENLDNLDTSKCNNLDESNLIISDI